MGTRTLRTTKRKAEKATFGCADGAYGSKVSARPEISERHGFCSKYGQQVRRGLRRGTSRGFLRRVGLVMYFARADKAATNMQPDPISAKEPKSA
jgi:hypothetical protein